jgi:hypothetical protein
MPVRTHIPVYIAIASLVAFPVSAQEAPKGFNMPLRADDVRGDPAKDVAIIEGTVEWSDGRTTTSTVITCSGKGLVLQLGDPKDGKLNVATWDVEPGFCTVLARLTVRRKP